MPGPRARDGHLADGIHPSCRPGTMPGPSARDGNLAVGADPALRASGRTTAHHRLGRNSWRRLTLPGPAIAVPGPGSRHPAGTTGLRHSARVWGSRNPARTAGSRCAARMRNPASVAGQPNPGIPAGRRRNLEPGTRSQEWYGHRRHPPTPSSRQDAVTQGQGWQPRRRNQPRAIQSPKPRRSSCPQMNAN